MRRAFATLHGENHRPFGTIPRLAEGGADGPLVGAAVMHQDVVGHPRPS